MTAIIDYKAGNLTSVALAFDALGEKSLVTSDPGEIMRAGRVVFPGVGAAGSAMAAIRSLRLEDAIRRAAATKPFLGICLGMQILFERTEEDGGVDLLGILPGRVRRFPAGTGDKVPQIGWNDVALRGGGARGFMRDGDDFYFVHSYCADVGAHTVATATYAGVEFTAAARKGSMFAVQFHPEKSGRTGLKLLEAFLKC